MCKLNKAGIAYEVDADGVRQTKRGTTRPPTFDSKEWWGLSDAVKKGIKEGLKAEAEKARSSSGAAREGARSCCASSPDRSTWAGFAKPG